MEQKSDAEQAFNGERISLTFREIATWYNQETGQIRGQGARNDELIIDDETEPRQCNQAFSQEDQDPNRAQLCPAKAKLRLDMVLML